MVFNENGDYTNLAEQIDSEARKALEPIIQKYISNSSIEELEYIISHCANKICLREKIKEQLEQKKGTEE